MGDVTVGVGLRVYGRGASGPRHQPQGAIFCFFLEKNRRRSASLEPLIGFLVFAFNKLWPKAIK